MKTRFAICHTRNGFPQYAFANHGRNHYDTAAAALEALPAYAPSLRGKLGYVDIHVRAVECYDHGDGMKILERVEVGAFTGIPFRARNS